jgi:hypothetical protein
MKALGGISARPACAIGCTAIEPFAGCRATGNSRRRPRRLTGYIHRLREKLILPDFLDLRLRHRAGVGCDKFGLGLWLAAIELAQSELVAHGDTLFLLLCRESNNGSGLEVIPPEIAGSSTRKSTWFWHTNSSLKRVPALCSSNDEQTKFSAAASTAEPEPGGSDCRSVGRSPPGHA